MHISVSFLSCLPQVAMIYIFLAFMNFAASRSAEHLFPPYVCVEWISWVPTLHPEYMCVCTQVIHRWDTIQNILCSSNTGV